MKYAPIAEYGTGPGGSPIAEGQLLQGHSRLSLQRQQSEPPEDRKKKIDLENSFKTEVISDVES